MWKDELTVVACALKEPAQFQQLLQLLPSGDVFLEPEIGRAWNNMKVLALRGRELTYENALAEIEHVDDPGAKTALNEAQALATRMHDPVSAGKRNAKRLARLTQLEKQQEVDTAAKIKAANEAEEARAKAGAAPAPQTNVGRGAAPEHHNSGGNVSSFNKVIIMGNLTADPELRSTPGGTPVAGITVAVNEAWTDQSGKKQESATFIDVTLWGKIAESVCRWKKKGDPVLVEGRLQQDKWQDKDTGKNRTKLKVTAETVTFVGAAGTAKAAA